MTFNDALYNNKKINQQSKSNHKMSLNSFKSPVLGHNIIKKDNCLEKMIDLNDGNMNNLNKLIRQGQLKKNYEMLISRLIQLKDQLQNSYQDSKQSISEEINTVESLSVDSQNPQNRDHFQIIQYKCKNIKLQEIRNSIIGLNSTYQSPFKFQLEAVYADHTATNRPYYAIQKIIQNAKRFQANPHTQFNHYGKYSTQMMKYAQKSLLKTFSASKDNYLALPAGNGSTGAIQKTIKVLKKIEQFQNAAVFLSEYEHHSNILPWVQYYGNVNILKSDQNGQFKMNQIYDQLKQCKQQKIIVSISAASNVTSQFTELDKMNTLIKTLKKIKQIVFCIDCAAYCCHKQLNLSKLDEIDFVFISPHKNLGGVQACGVLVAKKKFFEMLDKPTYSGGGTVAFVHGYTNKQISYHQNPFDRQIAGTPPFLAFYRAALSFQLLKQQIGYDFIRSQQNKNTTHFLSLIQQINRKFQRQKDGSKIMVYGLQNFQKRANVITFDIIKKQNKLHYNIVSLALADIFGIQIRSGCFCSGPFGMKILNINEQKAIEIKRLVMSGLKKQKPGYLRVDLPFYFLQKEIQYIAHAIELIAIYSDKLTELYHMQDNGQIIRKGCEITRFEGYQLSHWKKSEIQVQKANRLNCIKLKARSETLQIQLKNAQTFLRNYQV